MVGRYLADLVEPADAGALAAVLDPAAAHGSAEVRLLAVHLPPAPGTAAALCVLQVVAARLRSCLRPGDVAGRLGGDEMLVVARAVGDDAAAQVLGERVLAAPVGPASLRAGAVVARASIGLRRISAEDHDAAAVLRDADAALYRAKAQGGCRARLAGIGEGEASTPVGATPARAGG